MKTEIRKIKEEEILACLKVITTAFSTVALDFGFTKETAPTNPAFWTEDQMKEMQKNDIAMFGLFFNGNAIGFIAVERHDQSTYYIERLAVLPEYRHTGFGKMLMDFATQYIKNINGKTIQIALMDNNLRLKYWYKSFNFKETKTIQFPHLPFPVCYMEKAI